MERYEAIGMIETFGLVFVLEAADVELVLREHLAGEARQQMSS